ncbi:hypothetical protein M9H77_29493 [Catharanthus roseus]|uniref:Uncharacterized protein n=1 Tax=Catharanthus roseus TaxID=4058 RepID=A0ACB9ZYF5_CATRO|nr:hypothetical protein M9H77_29493 [Catharanthus roseus]
MLEVISSVVQRIEAFWLGILPILASVLDRITCLCRRFLWGGNFAKLLHTTYGNVGTKWILNSKTRIVIILLARSKYRQDSNALAQQMKRHENWEVAALRRHLIYPQDLNTTHEVQRSA